MKVAVVSDIHSDAKALARVFDEMGPVAHVLCVGDVVSDYQFCPDTVALLMQAGARTIKGNHENALFCGQNPGYLAKCRAQHAPELLDYLSQAPVTLELTLAGARILMVHANPWEPFNGYVMPGSRQVQRIAEMPYDYVLLGHTHVAMVEKAGNMLVVNPGSCSQPRGPAQQASYAILDLERRTADIMRLPRQ